MSSQSLSKDTEIGRMPKEWEELHKLEGELVAVEKKIEGYLRGFKEGNNV